MKRTAALGAAVVVVLGLFVGPIGLWPWDHDEVHSLMELGRIPLDRYPGPIAQLQRMHRLVPVWNALQNAALGVLPANEWGSRLLPSLCGALAVILAFLAALRHSRWLGWSLLVLTAGSQTLLWLSQQGRFYPMAILWTTIALMWMWHPSGRRRYDVLAAAAAAAAVLSHNLTLVVFSLGAAASVACWAAGWMPRHAARRGVAVGVTTVALYLVYLRPLLGGWISGGTGGTSPLVSFVAQIGIVPMGLAALGTVCIVRDRAETAMRWWVVLLVLSLAFVTTAERTVGNWNPRYGVFFMMPVWVVAAAGAAAIAEALVDRRRGAAPNVHDGLLGAAWLMALVVLLLPKLASHFIDGSRHDFRAAARVVSGISPAEPVLSNWPATLQYYLEPATGQRPRYWAPGDRLPDEPSVIVFASNAWDPVLQFAGRQVTIVGQVGHRRFDEQSHLIRVYRVGGR